MSEILSSFVESIDSIEKVLELECNWGNDWFDENIMIANPDKFRAILLEKSKTNLQILKEKQGFSISKEVIYKKE